MMSTCSYASSEGFLNVLKAIDMPFVNKNGYEANEEIYEKYNVIVYGNPLDKTEGQRWKDKEDGKWEYGKSSCSGGGRKGEYWILGENGFGKEVHNEYFPPDYISGISPEEWKYVEISDAIDSWDDLSKIQSNSQKEYMLNSKLMRGAVTYNMTAQDIGLSKARVESYATWRTKGIIYIKHVDSSGINWVATFEIPPMNKDANLTSILELENSLNYKVDKEDDNITIPINFGSIVDGLSEYTSKEDVKKITSTLYIDGNDVKNIELSRELEVHGNYNLLINKNDYSNDIKSIEISIKCVSILETFYDMDLPMYDEKEEVIIISLDGEDNIVEIKNKNKRYESGEMPKISSIEITRETTINGKTEYIKLNEAKNTGEEFVMAGQVIKIKVKTLNDVNHVTLEFEGDKSITTLDEYTKKFEWEEPKNRGIKTRYSSINQLKNSYTMPLSLKLEDDLGGGIKIFSCVYVIPYKTKQTLHSWSTLREINKNAFQIDENKIFSRITDPYQIVIKASSDVGIVTKRTNLDIFESWNTIYNRDLSKWIK